MAGLGGSILGLGGSLAGLGGSLAVFGSSLGGSLAGLGGSLAGLGSSLAGLGGSLLGFEVEMGQYRDGRYRYFVLSIVDTRYHNGQYRYQYSILFLFTSYNIIYCKTVSEKFIHP